MTFHEQGSDGWKAERAGRITASVAAGCLGLHPHMSRQEAYRRVVGEHVDVDNPFMIYGREQEPRARDAYEVETGLFVDVTGFHVHPLHPWLGASPDGLIGTDGLLEIKCSGKLPTTVPVYHRIQCLVQLAVTGRAWCDYCCWVNGETFIQRIHPQGIAGLVRKLERFYHDHVLTHTPPPRRKPRRRKKGATP